MPRPTLQIVILDDEGRIEGNETMLDELVRVEAALRPLREGD
jgi:signal recognition particle GTPase